MPLEGANSSLLLAAPHFGHVSPSLLFDSVVPGALSTSLVATSSDHVPTVLCVALAVAGECSRLPPDALRVFLVPPPMRSFHPGYPRNVSLSHVLSSWHMPSPQSV